MISIRLAYDLEPCSVWSKQSFEELSVEFQVSQDVQNLPHEGCVGVLLCSVFSHHFGFHFVLHDRPKVLSRIQIREVSRPLGSVEEIVHGSFTSCCVEFVRKQGALS